MIEFTLALMAGFVFSLSVILMRKGLSSSNVSSALPVNTLIGNIVLWPIVFIQNPQASFNIYWLLVLAFAGLVHPSVVRILYFQGMMKTGVSINATIFAMNPMFSVLFAILFLNEQPTAILWLGTAFVLVGIAVAETSVSNIDVVNVKKRALAIPAATSVIAGMGFALKKIGLNVYGEPILGAAVGFLVSFILCVIIFAVSSKTRSVTRIDTRTFRLFWKSGLCMAIGNILLFSAMQLDSVSSVTPLIQLEPLFVLILAYLFLKETEAFSKKLAFGAVIVLLGAILIAAFGV